MSRVIPPPPYAFMAWTEKVLPLYLKMVAKSNVCYNMNIHVKLYLDRRNPATETQKYNLPQKCPSRAKHFLLTTTYSSVGYLIPVFFLIGFLDTRNWQHFLQITDRLTTIQICTQNNCCINSKEHKVQAIIVLDVTLCSMAEIYTIQQ